MKTTGSLSQQRNALRFSTALLPPLASRPRKVLKFSTVPFPLLASRPRNALRFSIAPLPLLVSRLLLPPLIYRPLLPPLLSRPRNVLKFSTSLLPPFAFPPRNGSGCRTRYLQPNPKLKHKMLIQSLKRKGESKMKMRATEFQ